MSRRYGLSKSKITQFEQCPKRLWLSVHRPDVAELDEGADARFATGHEVGALAYTLVPHGVMIEAEPDLKAALDATRALLEAGHDRPIFEATFEHDGVLVRVDVLEPDGAGAWRMAEVKSSTKPKNYHLGDLATQLWVASQAGLKISSACLRHLNSRFVLEQEGDFRGLLIDSDLTAEAEVIARSRPAVVEAARATLGGDEPDVAPGDHCDAPFACEFASYCCAGLPAGPDWPVSVLPNGGGRKWLELGVVNLLDIDPSALTSAIHQRVHRATVTGEIFHDCAGARDAMAGWRFPRAWLDFETIAFAVPRWVGTRPYQQIPFQFSVHVEAEDGSLEHREFLSLDGADPRRACAEALIAAAPPTGAVVAYNASFEKSCINDLAAAFADLAAPLHSICDRLVDLLPVTRACWYHRDQRGSWSIKAVLPTVAPELAYDALDVQDGGAAQAAYLEAISASTDDERRAELAAGLRAYCGRDTEAMIILARRLLAEGIQDSDGEAA